MTSLLIHAGLGGLTVLAFFYVNAHLYRSEWPASRVTFLERLYYSTAFRLLRVVHDDGDQVVVAGVGDHARLDHGDARAHEGGGGAPGLAGALARD